jgi:4-diphosphocytidyl-2-C-methyl-D-erythritol kinase
MRLLAPAKINLHLRVGKRRADGFHPLCSWMTTIGLFDRLIFKANPATRERESGERETWDGGATATSAGQDANPVRDPQRGDVSGVGVVAAGLPLRCDDSTIPTDERNLVVKAARAFAQEAGLRSLPWSITLLKTIPHGGGLGGGSSDAATTLVALNHLFRTGWAVERLACVGATVGSDVPFFFSAPSAIIRGRGEQVRRTAAPVKKWVTLVLPDFGVSTAECYRRFDELGMGNDNEVDKANDFEAWATLSAADLSAKLINDLEPPAFAIQPKLGELRSQIERDTKHIVRMSGSGSSLFVLANDETEAMEVASVVKHNFGVRTQVVQLAPDSAVVDRTEC